MRKTFIPAGAAALLLAAAVMGLSSIGGGARADAGGMAAMRIDMEPFSAPANTATSIGPNETCARINENDVLDADEDVTPDTVTVDVTAKDIPLAHPMIGYSYWLEHDQASLTVQSQDAHFLLSSKPGSNLFVASDTTPDPEAPADNVWKSSVLDLGEGAAETGSGVLDRLAVSTGAGAALGDYQLSLSSAVHIDTEDVAYVPDNATVDSNGDTILDKVPDVAKISVNQSCAAGTGTATPTATPAPTTVPGFPKGDVDCNDAVDAVDALKVLRKVAGLSVMQNQGCTPLGEGDPAMGDMDCNGSVDAVDALRILRRVAGLNNTLPDGCAPIG